MKLVGLISGGKDSIFNLHQCVTAGHEIVALANIEPEAKEELNSYMYQTVGHNTISVLATALGLPIYKQKTKGKAVCKKKNYSETPQDEVEDLFSLLKRVKKETNIEGVAVGAIASDYQRTRVENVCRRLGLQSYAYLWRRNEEELLQEIIDSELDAVIIKVASMGLLPETHLGMHLKDIKPYLLDLNKKFGVSICGEGGEYETLTVDCPLFNRVINLTDFEKVVVSNDAFAPVAYLSVKNVTLDTKTEGNSNELICSNTSLAAYSSMNVKNPYDYIEDCVDKITFTLFPQKNPKAVTEDLPFPFSQDSAASKLNIREYWKSYSPQLHKSLSTLTRPQSASKLNVAIDKSICDHNYPSGWCCIGNIQTSGIQEAFSILRKNLERMKYEFSDIVLVHLLVKNMKEFNAINKVFTEVMPKALPPARICIETNLPPDFSILMSVVAHKPVSKSQLVLSSNTQPQRETMQVESISHWAPACIGPYSQCVRVGEFYYLAGQIPLIPGAMEILNKPIYHQCKLTLRHVQRIMEAMNDKLTFENILIAVCYVTSEQIVSCIDSLWSHITNFKNALVTGVVVTGLPKEAQLEWEVIAYESNNPTIIEKEEIVDNYKVVVKQFVNKEPPGSALLSKVYNLKSKSSTNTKSILILTDSGVKNVIQECISYLKTEMKSVLNPLCFLKVYYKSGDVVTLNVIDNFTRNLDCKVVLTGIPVIACEEPDIFLTITGVCH